MNRFMKLGLLMTLAIAFAGCQSPTAPLSRGKELVSFVFERDKNAAALTADYSATYNEVSGKWSIGPLPASTDVSRLVATFALSVGASMDLYGVAQVSGETANDFTRDVAYWITAADGSTTAATVSVSVTVPVSNCALTAYSLSCDGVSYAGAIDETAKTIAVRLPSGSDVSAAIATFAQSTGASVVIGTTAQVSGATPNDFSSSIEYVVTSLDGADSAVYTVSATVNPVAPIQIIGFVTDHLSYYADRAGRWIDLLVVDADALVSGWTLKAMGIELSEYKVVTVFSSTSIPMGWALADGDVIRIHLSPYTGVSDTTTKADDTVNVGIWDYTAPSVFLESDDGVICVQDSSEAASIVDIVAYTCDKNPNYWPDDWLPWTVRDLLTQAATELQWPSADFSDAFDMGNSVLCAPKLLDSVRAVRDGNRAADWEPAEPSEVFDVISTTLSNQSVQGSVGGNTVITTEIYALGGATVASVTADLSAIGGTASDTLVPDGAYLHSRTINVAIDSTVGNYTIPVTIKDGDGNTYPDAVMLRVTSGLPIVPAFPDSDMEAPMHSTIYGLNPSGTGYASVTGYDGSATNALHVSGTTSSGNVVFKSALPTYDMGEHTKVTFWIKGSSTDLGLSVVIGGSGWYWTIPAINNTTPDPVTMVSSQDYSVPIVADAGTEHNGWFKVTLALGSVDAGDRSFTLFHGMYGAYDLYIDDIAYE